MEASQLCSAAASRSPLRTHRWALLPLLLIPQAASLAPNFDAFNAAATGAWAGSRYTWSSRPIDDHVELSAGDGDRWWLAVPVASETDVAEVMRSCGGAVQGVRATTDGVEGPLLNRQDDGFVYFDDGSWCFGPTTTETLAFDVCLSHGDRSRRRVRCVLDGTTTVDVAEVVHEARAGDAAASAQALLSGQLSVVASAAAWEGGATNDVLEARASPWLLPRAKWTRAPADVAGGAPLVPPGATALPGGVFISATAAGDALDVAVGSVVFSDDGAGEFVVATRSYERGALAAVRLERVCPRDVGAP